MNIASPKFLAWVMGVVLLVCQPIAAAAQFLASDAKLFVDWPNLQVDPIPGQQSEAAIHAIVHEPRVLYTISMTNRFNIAVLGAFQCNEEFTVLTSHSNGFFDIRCVDQNVFNEPTSYVLKINGSTYIQDFSSP